MTTRMIITLIAGALAVGSAASAAEAKHLSDRERQRLENEQRAQESIAKDWNSAAKDYDRAYRAARTADKVFQHAIREIPGGNMVYSGSKAATRAAIRAANRRRN